MSGDGKAGPHCGCDAQISSRGHQGHADHRITPSSLSEVLYTCPMHPQIRRNGPGTCPICGMALEPLRPTRDSTPGSELGDMTRRFWIGALLSTPLVVQEMTAHLRGMTPHHSPSWTTLWIELALATPVVWWAGGPFWVRAWASVRHRSLNMFTLIALGTGAAYLYSLVAACPGHGRAEDCPILKALGDEDPG